VLPTLSRFLTGVPYLLTGLIILEREFRLGGLSSLFFVSIEEANTPLIIGTLLMMGVIGVAARVVLDVLHFTLDPRIRVPGEAA
jgi:peptide/nickel transport system permease protein